MRQKMRSLKARIINELYVYRLVMRDARTPKPSKILLGLALAYALSPINLVPDFIPVIGYVDDLIIVPILVILALKLAPKQVVEDCRIRALQVAS